MDLYNIVTDKAEHTGREDVILTNAILVNRCEDEKKDEIKTENKIESSKISDKNSDAEELSLPVPGILEKKVVDDILQLRNSSYMEQIDVSREEIVETTPTENCTLMQQWNREVVSDLEKTSQESDHKKNTNTLSKGVYELLEYSRTLPSTPDTACELIAGKVTLPNETFDNSDTFSLFDAKTIPCDTELKSESVQGESSKWLSDFKTELLNLPINCDDGPILLHPTEQCRNASEVATQSCEGLVSQLTHKQCNDVGSNTESASTGIHNDLVSLNQQVPSNSDQERKSCDTIKVDTDTMCNRYFLRQRKNKAIYDETTTEQQNIRMTIGQNRCKKKSSEPYNYQPRNRKSNVKDSSCSCFACHQIFRSKEDLQIHQNQKSCDGLFQCVTCGEKFSSIEMLCSHGSKFHKVFICNICGRVFKTLSGMTRHKMDHTGNKPYSCTKCSKSYKTRGELVIHNRYHTGELPFHCKTCLKNFPTRAQLRRHKTMHKYDHVTPTCATCGRVFKKWSSLLCHEHAHKRAPLHECSKCGNIFPSRSSLLSHGGIHIEKPLYHCSQCSKDFETSLSYLHHQVIAHDVEKPNKCNKCSMTFQLQSSLRCHQLLHEEGASHKCKKCGEIFKSRLSLLYHELVHNTRSPSYKCAGCTRTFKTQLQMEKHAVIHALPQQWFPCKLCDKTYKIKSSLLRHQRRSHQ